METNYVIINSKFRSEGSKSTSDFTFSLGETLEISDVAIKSVSIVNAEYNIKAGHNTLVVNNGLVDSTITVPAGQYTLSELITTIETQLTSIYGGVNTLTLGANNKKLTFSTTTALRYGTDLTTSPIGFILGLGDERNAFSTTYYPEIASVAFVAPFLPNLQGANNYHIVSNTIGQGQGSLLKNNDKRPIILTVPVTQDFGSVINYEVNEIKLNKRHFSRPVNIQEIDIKVIDDDNELVDLGGTNIEIILQILRAPILPYSVSGDRIRMH
jgi:hypothetical protein